MSGKNGLKELVQKLKSNEENVPRSELEGKYSKPYRKLKEDIKAEADKILKEKLIEGLVIVKDEAGNKVLCQIRDFVDKQIQAGSQRELGRLLFKKYDVKGFLQAVDSIHHEIIKIWEVYRKENLSTHQEDR